MVRKRISIVVPVHNEARFLRYTLPHLEGTIYEKIFVLDTCTDRSLTLIQHNISDYNIWEVEGGIWRNRCAEAFQYGFEKAKGDIILALGADMIPDPYLPLYILDDLRGDVGLVDYRYRNWSLDGVVQLIHSLYTNKYVSLTQRFRRALHTTGFYAVRRKVLEEIGGLRDVPSEYLDLHKRVEEAGWTTSYDPRSKTLHLRPGTLREKQVGQAEARLKLSEYNLVKTFLHGIVTLKPEVVAEYLRRRFT